MLPKAQDPGRVSAAGPSFVRSKHRTLPVRLWQVLFVLLKAQNAARLLGAAHPGPRLDFTRRGRGGKAGGTNSPFHLFFLWFSLSKGHIKNPSCKILKISTFEPIEIDISRARGP